MNLEREVKKIGNEIIAERSRSFFKTAPGEYSHGDIFLGIRSGALRSLAKEHYSLSMTETKKLVRSKYHEVRLLGLLILVKKFEKSSSELERERLFKFYTSHFKHINNWDLVDVTCPHIVGKYLMNRDRTCLYDWAKSNDLWTKRISIVSNWWFIRNGDLKDVFKISKILLKDEHDLIHKAVGWMLREAAKKDLAKAETFLKKNYANMPRTMLRYAIEKFPEIKRQKYLKGEIDV